MSTVVPLRNILEGLPDTTASASSTRPAPRNNRVEKRAIRLPRGRQPSESSKILFLGVAPLLQLGFLALRVRHPPAFLCNLAYP